MENKNVCLRDTAEICCCEADCLASLLGIVAAELERTHPHQAKVEINAINYLHRRLLAHTDSLTELVEALA